MKIRNFKATDEWWERFKAHCAENGTNASEAIKLLGTAWMEGRIDAEQFMVKTEQSSESTRADAESLPESIRDELDAMRQQIQALTEAMGNSSGGDRPQHPHHPEVYGDPANFQGSNPNRPRIRDKLPA